MSKHKEEHPDALESAQHNAEARRKAEWRENHKRVAQRAATRSIHSFPTGASPAGTVWRRLRDLIFF